MRVKIIILTVLMLSYNAFGWGVTGHKTIGKLTEKQLSKKAKKNIKKILKRESISEVSLWMDKVKFDSQYEYMKDWHWVNIPDSVTYGKTKMNQNGDVYVTILRVIAELESHQLPKAKEREALKILIHLVGDIHQPLNIRNGKDKGGKDIKVNWFAKKTDLFTVWENEIITQSKFTASDFLKNLNAISDEEIKKWQSDPIEVWLTEAQNLRRYIYDLPENKNLDSFYFNENLPIIELQVLKSSVRLAGILNRIYG